MVRIATMALLCAVSGPGLLLAQTREQGTIPPPAQQQPAGIPGSAAAANVGTSLSSSMTGAPVALGPGDLLEIAVFDTPELTQKIRVNSEGRIALALIGEIDVRGMTPEALEKLIRTRLMGGHFVKDPQVSVFVAEFSGQMAYVTGEVNRPGAYPLMRSHHLSDLIAVAGGLSARAGNGATIVHAGNSAPSTTVDLADPDEARKNPEIMPGDSITVGQTGIAYVLGDVNRPGGFLLDRRGSLSVVQAIALAEGAMPSASIRKAELIRTREGVREQIPIDLKLILQSKVPDPQLQGGDILYIPTSMARGLGRASLQTILATMSGIAIYSSYRY